MKSDILPVYKNDIDENETADDLDAYAYADNIGNTFSEDDETVISCNFNHYFAFFS